MKIIISFVLALTSSSQCLPLDHQHLQILLKNFKIYNPNIISNKVSFLNSRGTLDVIKTMMKESQLVNARTTWTNNTIYQTGSNGLVLYSDFNFIKNIKMDISSPWIIFSDDAEPSYFSEIDQPVYFYNSGSLNEQYRFKSLKVKRNLGNIVNDKFVWRDEIDSDILKRRRDLQNMTLIGMTLPEASFMIVPNEYFDKNGLTNEIIKDAFDVM